MRKLSVLLGGAAVVGLAALLSVPQPVVAQASGVLDGAPDPADGSFRVPSPQAES